MKYGRKIPENIELPGVSRDLSALKDLFFQYHARLVLFACKLTGEMEAARDIVQDTFLNLWERSEDLSVRVSVKAYLFQSVRNRCLNYLRHQKTGRTVRERIAEQINREERNLYFDPVTPFHSLLESELEHKVSEIVDSMPEKCREVFFYSRHMHLRNREIAEKMGVSVKMVEKYISKSLRMLRAGLPDYRYWIIFIIIFF